MSVTCSVWCGVSNNYAAIICQASLLIITRQIGDNLHMRKVENFVVNRSWYLSSKSRKFPSFTKPEIIYRIHNRSSLYAIGAKSNSMLTLTSYFLWSTLILFLHLSLWIPSDLLTSDFATKIMTTLPFLFMYFMEFVHLLVFKIKTK